MIIGPVSPVTICLIGDVLERWEHSVDSYTLSATRLITYLSSLSGHVDSWDGFRHNADF